MFPKKFGYCLLGSAFLLSSIASQAQQPSSQSTNSPIEQMHVGYGLPINLEDAKKVAAAAIAFAEKQKWDMAVAVVDTAGGLVYFERMNGTESAGSEMSVAKAKTSVTYRRPTKAFQDSLAQGGANLRILGMTGVIPVDGGVPIVVGGKIIGAIGTSGGSSEEDGRCATAGAAALQ